MNKQERIYFEELIKDREDSYRLMEKQSMSAIEDLVVQKYSEKAHFIHELLQNADDTKATEAHFELNKNGLRFWHNGSEHFSIISPQLENDKKYRGPNGHVNAIVAIGNSTKGRDGSQEYKIGKFGIGFKAVFQYTKTPHVYDDCFSFYIRNLIIPVLLDKDDSKRKQGETLFYFPFNSDDNSPEASYEDIAEKLQTLQFPLLFLNYLQKIYWTIEGITGTYSQKEKIIPQFKGSAKSIKTVFTSSAISSHRIQNLILFTRKESETGLEYSVGFCLNDRKNTIEPVTVPVFCYFPTTKASGLSFIVHAPFKLINNREGFPNNKWNSYLVDLLASLAADSLINLCELNLIHDDVFDIIPYTYTYDWFQYPFYNRFLNAFKTQQIIPCLGGGYVTAEHAYWPSSASIPEFFPKEQLKSLTKDEKAEWVFVKNNYKALANNYKPLAAYLDNIIKDDNNQKHRLEESTIFARFTPEFIKAQPIEWFHLLYKYLQKAESTWKDVKTKPIFLDQNRNAVAAYKYDFSSKRFEKILFVDTIEGSTLTTILDELLENDTSFEFIKAFGICKPELRDEIYNDILPQYSKSGGINTKPHFKKFYQYYKQCGNEEQLAFLDLIRSLNFIIARKYPYAEDKTYRVKADEIYFYSDGLAAYFRNSKNYIWFMEEDDYEDVFEEEGRKNVEDFLQKLGVRKYIAKKSTWKLANYGEEQYLKEIKEKNGITPNSRNIIDYYYPLFEENLIEMTKAISIEIWNSAVYEISLDPMGLMGKHKKDYFVSYLLWMLQNKAWLYSKTCELFAPIQIFVGDLDEQYDIKSEAALTLCKLLHFKSEQMSVTEALKHARMVLTDEVISRILMEAAKEKNAGEYFGEKGEPKLNKEYEVKRKELANSPEGNEPIYNEVEDEEQTPSYDYDPEKIEEEIRKRLDEETKLKCNRKELVEGINKSKKYSYEWFLNYIALMSTYSERLSPDKRSSVSFSSIEAEKRSNRFFILDGANRFIPEDISESEGAMIRLWYDDDTASDEIKIEGVSRIGQKVQILTDSAVSEMVLEKMKRVRRVEFQYTPVIDLIGRLQNAFVNSSIIDRWDDISDALPSIQYIYGPPGTGKTWTIGKKIESITKCNKAHILVLTPTNKAADEVCKKVRSNEIYVSVVRLSKATDIELQDMGGIYFDSLSVSEVDQIPVVASTIHRLPYFELQGGDDMNSCKLFQYPWDYVVFDESSMIGLHYIVFAIMAIYKSNPRVKFIVAGDPMQIPPIVEINDEDLEHFEVQDENIYTMMGISSFDNTQKQIRFIDSIENLDTQHRSVPAIGQLYSDLSYSSLLNHNREDKPDKALPTAFQSILQSAVTFVDLPLVKTVDTYKVYKLHGSSYHFYSAILVMEFLKRFDMENNKEQKQEWNIGLIAPYKAQAILMDKLVTSYNFSPHLKIVSDTVHGFQGGECDIVFFVCNPNSYGISNNSKLKDKCLLNKQYIYNVAISRARDYLVVLHPFSWIKNNLFINKITKAYAIQNGCLDYVPYDELERKLFGMDGYIRENSYVTSHDSVNVYNTALMKRYILKHGVDTLDVQVLGTTNNNTQSK